MKYSIFFGCFFLYASFELYSAKSLWEFLWGWPACCFLLMTLSYTLHRPGLVCGKRKDGSINPFLILINLPWLLLTWGVWTLESVISKEDAVNKIPGTNISLGRYPRFCNLKETYDLIVDLTSEFPKSCEKAEYICLPNLDGVALTNTDLPVSIHSNQNVLIHCAQGHGRSATFAAILINKLDRQVSRKDAYKKIREARPAAKVSIGQMAQLRV